MIALAGTTVPADVKERCRRSFEHIRQYFLREVGKTFQVAELQIIQTHLTAKHFQEFRSEYVPLLDDLIQLCRERTGQKYGPGVSGKDIFCFNLIAFIRQVLNADNSQAWVIFIPAGARVPYLGAWGIAAGGHLWPGGYAIISANYLSEEFVSGNLPASDYTPDRHVWSSGGHVEKLTAHELGHVFGLGWDNLQNAGEHLMGDRELEGVLQGCLLTQRERWILLRSPFFTEEKL